MQNFKFYSSVVLAAMLLLFAVSSHGQGLKFSLDTTTKHPFLTISKGQLQIQDSAKGLVAYQNKDSALVVLDSAATIKVLMNCIQQMIEQNKKLYQGRK